MKKIVDYYVALADDLHSLEEIVKNKIKENYEPIGSLVLNPKKEFTQYLQPMVKRIKIGKKFTKNSAYVFMQAAKDLLAKSHTAY